MAKARKRKSTKMREGECRRTKAGMEYCKHDGEVRFIGQMGELASQMGELEGARRKPRRKRGKTCKRFKLVKVKGTTGKQRRCAGY